MTTRQIVRFEEAMETAEKLGIDFSKVAFLPQQFSMGMDTEMMIATWYPERGVSPDDLITLGKMALAQLEKNRDYYGLIRTDEEWEQEKK